MNKKTYLVARSMTSDGKDYARGDKRELLEGDASALVASGALIEVKSATKPKKAGSKPAKKSAN